MKKMLMLGLLASHTSFAQMQNGGVVPDIDFHTILNAPVKHIKLSQLKGKIVLIEYWATWCGSCLSAMPHLERIQKKYGNKLQVITVTDETEKRTLQFLSSRPSGLWFSIDTGEVIHNKFPHQLIPHSVLISPEGKLMANADPASVTDEVLDSLLRHQPVHLPQKKDNLMGINELLGKYFYAEATVKNRFSMNAKIEGAPGFSTIYLNDSNFNGRRITAVNVGLFNLYSLAFGNFPSTRVIDSMPAKDKLPVYGMDIIVEKKSDLLPSLRKELLQRFDVQAKVKTQTRQVYVLKVMDAQKFKTIPVNTSHMRTYSASHGAIDQQGMTMHDLADFLEIYGSGTGGWPVIDETNMPGEFDIKFFFQPENPSSLVEILAGMGLRLEKAERDVKMLLLYKAQ